MRTAYTHYLRIFNGISFAFGVLCAIACAYAIAEIFVNGNESKSNCFIGISDCRSCGNNGKARKCPRFPMCAARNGTHSYLPDATYNGLFTKDDAVAWHFSMCFEVIINFHLITVFCCAHAFVRVAYTIVSFNISSNVMLKYHFNFYHDDEQTPIMSHVHSINSRHFLRSERTPDEMWMSTNVCYSFQHSSNECSYLLCAFHLLTNNRQNSIYLPLP